MTQAIHVDPRTDATVGRIAAAVGYRGRTVELRAATRVTLRNTYWDGGTRSTYTAVRLDTFQATGAPRYNPPQFGGPKVAPEVDVPPGVAIVEHVIFCGKDLGLHVFVHPDTFAPLLPPPVELTDAERACLAATAGLKNTYSGRTEIRFHEAARVTGVTRAQWDAAAEALIARGLLNKQRAITPAGRTAIGNTRLDHLRRRA